MINKRNRTFSIEEFPPLIAPTAPNVDGYNSDIPPIDVNVDASIHLNYHAPEGCPCVDVTHDDNGCRVGFHPAEWYDLKTMHLLDPSTRAQMQKNRVPLADLSPEAAVSVSADINKQYNNLINENNGE